MNDLEKHVEMLVRKAGKRVLEIYSTEFEVIRKSDGSPVTAADLAAQDILSNGLEQYGWPILSEEAEDSTDRLRAQRVWIIDPIDGTFGFTQKNGEFAIQVGLVENGVPIFGVVYRPTTDQYFYAHQGKGSFLIDRESVASRRLAVSTTSEITDAVLAISGSRVDRANMDEIKKIGFDSHLHVGGIGVRIGLIVEKQAEVYITETDRLGEWDICAPQIILEEAGGIMTGLNGETLTYNNKDPHNPHGVLAATKSLHPILLEKIRSRNNIDMI